MRSVNICKQVLKEKNLAPNAIAKVLLVGGPTLAPYFREILQSTLGIPLDHSVDPLTVVARGASVFAGTQRLDRNAGTKINVGTFEVVLANYKSIGADLDPTVRGEVKPAGNVSLVGFTIEFVNNKTHWRSGKIPIKADGRFKAGLLAEKGAQNTFAIELLDAKGRKQAVTPDRLTYTVGLAISEQPLIHSIAVALANNETHVFLRKGDPLPAKAMHDFRSTHGLKKGESGDVLRVPIVEGDTALADRNPLLGTLEIKGASIRRDLPAGTEIEVTLHMDSSRIIRAKAYIPMLDEEFEAVIEHERQTPDHKTLQREHGVVVQRLQRLQEQAEDGEGDDAVTVVDEILEANEAAGIEPLIEAAKGDPDAAKHAESRLLEVKIKLDKAEDALKWPSLVANANKALDELDELVDEHGNSSQSDRAAVLREQVEELISQLRAEPLQKKVEQIGDLHREILFEQDAFWVGFFQQLETESNKMKDRNAAERLVSQGHQCIARE
jgi:molecular chaperone DnaK